MYLGKEVGLYVDDLSVQLLPYIYFKVVCCGPAKRQELSNTAKIYLFNISILRRLLSKS